MKYIEMNHIDIETLVSILNNIKIGTQLTEFRTFPAQNPVKMG